MRVDQHETGLLPFTLYFGSTSRFIYSPINVLMHIDARRRTRRRRTPWTRRTTTGSAQKLEMPSGGVGSSWKAKSKALVGTVRRATVTPPMAALQLLHS